MARKTIKGLEEIISDLEKRLDEQYKINMELHNQISQMKEVEDEKFEHSPLYRQMDKEIEQLKSLRNNLKPKEKQIKDSDIEYIKELRNKGLSYREISKKTSWSKATICRVLNGMYD